MITLTLRYLLWHYSTAIGDIIRIWTNYLWFFYNFFSISLLFKTLLDPWERLKEKYDLRSIEDWASALVTNTIMRLVGFIVRLFTIVFGLLVLLVVVLIGLVTIILWLVLPFLLSVMFIRGLQIIFS
ncbi:MAG: hypothetical protein WCW87_01415 [Candidatus Paceibacterota bacterium]